MSVSVLRMCDSRINRNVVNGIRFESVRITIRNSFEPGSEDFRKYAEICTDMFPSDMPETEILGEIIHYGIETLHAMVCAGKEHDEEAKE